MKLFILTIALFITIPTVFCQSISIVDANNPGVDISGTVIEVVGDKNDQLIYKDMRIINTDSKSINVKYNRIRTYDSGRIDQICDNSLCYNADNSYSYTSPVLNTISPGDSSIFKPQIVPDDMESCAIHKYYVVSDFNTVFDSITVIFRTTETNCNLGIEQETPKVHFTIFPNPAQNLVTIHGEALENGGTIIFIDALGKEVKRTDVRNNTNEINVADLKRGVYFVKIQHKDGESNIQRLVKQ